MLLSPEQVKLLRISQSFSSICCSQVGSTTALGLLFVTSIFCLLPASQKCDCKAARSCEREEQLMFCIQPSRSARPRSLGLCAMAALKCASYDFEILREGVCESR